jgi:hypothetical protein
MNIKGNITTPVVNEYNCVLTDSGTANSYAVAPRPAISDYSVGLKLIFKAANTNTGISSIAVSGLAGRAILKGASQVLPGDIQANQIITIIYDGSGFQMQNTPGTVLGVIPAIKLIQNYDLHDAVNIIASKSGTVFGTDGLGSSIFLHRVTIPSRLFLTEVDVAMSIGFPATNQGAGSRTHVFGLFSIHSASSDVYTKVYGSAATSSWNTGTSTVGASSSLTQFQGGWSGPLIHPNFLALTTSVSAGEYVVANLFNFSQASSTWTIAMFGKKPSITFLASAATNLTSATIGALSSGGLVGVSAHTASSSGSFTAFSAAPTVFNALSSSALAAASGITGLTQIVTSNAANTMWVIDRGSSAASSAKISSSIFTVVQHAFVSSLGTLTGSIFTASGSGAVLSNAGTAAFGNFLSSGGFSAGSFIGTSGSLGAVTNVALGALNSSTLGQPSFVNLGYIGKGSTTASIPSALICGIYSSGGVPNSFTLSDTALTYTGSFAFQQPWFALVGS